MLPIPKLKDAPRTPRTGVPANWQMSQFESGDVGQGRVGVSVIHRWTWEGTGTGCEVKELVQTVESRGCFGNATAQVQRGWENGDRMQVSDEHGTLRSAIVSEGYCKTLQLFVYSNDSTPQQVVLASGYEIIRQARRISPSSFSLSVDVHGAAVQIGDLRSAPGLGAASYVGNVP